MINEYDLKDWIGMGYTQPERINLDKLVMYPTNQEYDPNGRSSKEAGAKLDGGKSPIFQGLLDYFPRSCEAIAKVSEVGAKKYSWKGWETVPDGIARYSNALARHLIREAIEEVDKESGRLHAEQVAWNSLARLELILREKETHNG